MSSFKQSGLLYPDSKKVRSQNSDSGSDIKRKDQERFRILGNEDVGFGVGKGVYGRAINSGKKFCKSIFGVNVQCCKPGEERYPKYNTCISVKSIYELPPLLSCPIDSLSSRCLIIGPDKGFIECINDITERKKYLRTQGKLLLQNPNALNDINTLSSSELSVEEIKRKQLQMKTLEKKIKKIIPHLDRLNNTKDPRIFGKTIATYAYDCIKNTQTGEPNADSFYAETFDNMLVFAVADGIGWGIPSRRSSQSALLGFATTILDFHLKRKSSQVDTQTLASICFDGINLGHLSCFCNTESKTTFCGGIVIQLQHQSNDDNDSPLLFNDNINDDCDIDSESESEEDIQEIKKKWVFVGISVGDSLIYRYSSSSMEVMELTISDRTGGVRDAGGCLGGKEPDLRNMTYHCCLAEEGDLFISVSDGVHDNLDPEVLQVPLSETEYEVDVPTWSDLDPIQKNDLKRRFKEDKLLEIIENVDEINPSNVTEAILNEITEITRPQREGYEQGSLLQRDWDKMEEKERNDLNLWVQDTLKNPVGKFDHVTCLVTQVGPTPSQWGKN